MSPGSPILSQLREQDVMPEHISCPTFASSKFSRSKYGMSYKKFCPRSGIPEASRRWHCSRAAHSLVTLFQYERTVGDRTMNGNDERFAARTAKPIDLFVPPSSNIADKKGRAVCRRLVYPGVDLLERRVDNDRPLGGLYSAKELSRFALARSASTMGLSDHIWKR